MGVDVGKWHGAGGVGREQGVEGGGREAVAWLG